MEGLIKKEDIVEEILFVAVNEDIKSENDDVSSQNGNHAQDYVVKKEEVDCDKPEGNVNVFSEFYKSDSCEERDLTNHLDHTVADQDICAETKFDLDSNFPSHLFECYIGNESSEYLISTHLGKKLYKCTECDYSSNRKTHVVTHMRTHTGEKPFKCSVCDYTSAEKGSLVRHMRTHTGEKPFKCTECEYSSNRKTHVVTHMRTHTGENPFKCTECDYSSSRKDTLVKHVRIHTGEKPFKCTQCDYCSTRKCNLARHIRTHTGEKPLR